MQLELCKPEPLLRHLPGLSSCMKYTNYCYKKGELMDEKIDDKSSQPSLTLVSQQNEVCCWSVMHQKCAE